MKGKEGREGGEVGRGGEGEGRGGEGRGEERRGEERGGGRRERGREGGREKTHISSPRPRSSGSWLDAQTGHPHTRTCHKMNT